MKRLPSKKQQKTHMSITGLWVFLKTDSGNKVALDDRGKSSVHFLIIFSDFIAINGLTNKLHIF